MFDRIRIDLYQGDNMTKKIWILIIVICMVGCSKKETKVETVIEYNDSAKIAINYPITHIKTIDNLISNYIDKTYDSFKTDHDNKKGNISELNISYSYKQINQYISISLTTFISTNSLVHSINEVYTLVYDTNKNKVLKLGDLYNDNQLKNLIPKIKQQLINKYKECIFTDLIDSKINANLKNSNLFLIDKNGVTLFFNPYEITSRTCDIINVQLPFETNYTKNEEPVSIIPNVIEYDPTKPTIALTFDDGPSKYTKKIIELLKKHEAVGTFFVIGNKVDIYRETITLMHQNGNEIGNHSYDHKWLTRLTDKEFYDQINKTQNLVKNITGFTPKLLRPTYGSINNRIRKNTNLDIVMWDVDTNDWRTKNYKNIATKALYSIKDGDIILMHDIYERTYKALELMIPKLKEQGFQFVTVSELKEIKELKNKSN